MSEIVVIGHSQGGLLTKAMVVDTGDRVWNAIANKPAHRRPKQGEMHSARLHQDLLSRISDHIEASEERCIAAKLSVTQATELVH